MEYEKEYTESFFLAPGECDAERRLPLSLLTMRLIQVATYHANSWGIGYADLVKDNQTWVLSRVTIEMKRYPIVNETYSLTTWIENFNRHYSERNFAICDSLGDEIGYARTVWVIMDINTRTGADMSKFECIAQNISSRVCPISPQSKIRLNSDNQRHGTYRFKYSDIDFNRHVNSCRYIDLLMNQWNLEFHDMHVIKRFEIAYMREVKFDESVAIGIDETSLDCKCEMSQNGTVFCKSRIVFEKS